MKNQTIIILILMPVLAFGQSNFNKKPFDHSHFPIAVEKHLISEASIDTENNIEMTLVDDRKYYKSVLNFDLDKSYALSHIRKNNNIFEFIDDQKLDEKLLEVEPFMDFKWQFRKAPNTKGLFENQ